jgi:hypothetical protein
MRNRLGLLLAGPRGPSLRRAVTGTAALALAGAVLGLGLVPACSKQDEALIAKLRDANDKLLSCQKELAETKVARDNYKRQLATALADPSKIVLNDPEIIELIAVVKKERGVVAGNELNPKDASAIVMRGAPAMQGCYERALKKNSALQFRAGLGVTLGITVRPSGDVEGVDVTPSVDADMTKCISGNAVTIEQKLTLTPKT